jgi:hypothetical protein
MHMEDRHLFTDLLTADSPTVSQLMFHYCKKIHLIYLFFFTCAITKWLVEYTDIDVT